MLKCQCHRDLSRPWPGMLQVEDCRASLPPVDTSRPALQRFPEWGGRGTGSHAAAAFQTKNVLGEGPEKDTVGEKMRGGHVGDWKACGVRETKFPHTHLEECQKRANFIVSQRDLLRNPLHRMSPSQDVSSVYRKDE